MHPSRYRIRILLDIIYIFLLPLAVSTLALPQTGRRLGLLSIPCHIIFIVFWGIAKGWYSRFVQHLQATKLGAKRIPCVVGKWPGNIDILLRMITAFKSSYLLDVYWELFKEYQCTTLNTRILWADLIITMDQEHSKYILTTGFNYFWRGRAQKERMETFLGAGIFNRDDKEWKMHRTIARPFFARERISDFELFERHTAKTLAIISSLSLSDAPCEAQDLYARFTLDAASEFLFGKNLDTLSGSLPIPGLTKMGPKGSATHDTWGSFAQAFEMVQQIVTIRARIGYFWPLFELFGDKTTPHVKAIRKWLDPIVETALADKKKMEDAGVCNSVDEKTFLQHLADSTRDPVLIRDQLLSMLLAARDTTASLLTCITYFMAIHPDVAQKLRAEVLEHCGQQGAPTYENIRKLKYMRGVINETLRLFPPVPLNIRESRAPPCTLPASDPTYSNSGYSSSQPYYMPGATPIMFFPMLTQRNPVLWGEDADEFIPERWIDPERLQIFTSNPMMYTPFSAGPRICIGQNYAYNETSCFLVRLLQRFDTFTLVPEFQPEGSLPPPEWKAREGRQRVERIWPGAAMTLYVKGGMWVQFCKSKSKPS